MTLRPIPIPETPPHSLADQPVPQLQWVKVADMVLDDAYQRGVAAAPVRRIAADFRWSRFLPVLLAPVEGGLFAIVDGQHRAHAAALCGIAALPAMIVPMSARQQADAFRHVNGAVTKVTAYQLWRAARAAGEPWAEACGRAVEDAGCRITSNMGGHQRGPRNVTSVLLVRRHVADGTEAVVTAGLRALAAHPANAGNGDYWACPILRGWFDALASNQLFLRLDLVAFLDSWDLLLEYDDAVEAVRANPRMGGARPLFSARTATALGEFRAEAAA